MANVAHPVNPIYRAPVSGGVAQPSVQYVVQQPQQQVQPNLTSQLQAAHAQSLAAARTRAGGDGGHMKGSSVWLWGLLILFFILIILAIAWFLWSRYCGRRRKAILVEERCRKRKKCKDDCSDSDSCSEKSC